MNEPTFFFYDLETSGVNARSSRVMQFAGVRTSLTLEPVDDPVNILIALTPDVLPDPDAILITGITPQKTIEEGVTEAEFCKQFMSEVATPGTIFVGFNSIRFDDEFMRFLLWRNYYDPYEWQWKNDNSKWDILDIARMTRALRPDGIEWPFASDGSPSNRLELLTSVNKLNHENAHDALSDVYATLSVAQLIRSKQPKLFDYMLKMRDKKQVQAFLNENDMFVYTSGKYASEHEKTTVVSSLMSHPDSSGMYVFDLRYDPKDYTSLSPEELAKLWQYNKDKTAPRLPVKLLKFNRCPAIGPLSVLDDATKERLHIDLDIMNTRSKLLRSDATFRQNILKAVQILDKKREQTYLISHEKKSEELLYDSFISASDKKQTEVIRKAEPKELLTFAESLQDDRLKSMLPRYKARNYPRSLTSEEKEQWDSYCREAITEGGEKSRLAIFSARLSEIAAKENVTKNEQYLVEELQLYAQSLL